MRLRLLIAGVALSLTLAGTLWGSDDDFPFGPFRMYATSARPNGNVRTAELIGVRADGTAEPLTVSVAGVRRAELEGQLPRFRDDPDSLAIFARPGDVAVRLVEHVRHVVDRVVQPGERVEVIAEWRR